jgi:anti-anti-sigma factor
VAGAADPLEIAVVQRGERTFVVTLAGELDLGTSPGLARRLETLSGSGPRRIVIDLDRLAFIDSSGIHVLVTAARGLQAGGGRLALASPGPHVRRVLEIAHVPDVVAVADSVETALADSGGAAAG